MGLFKHIAEKFNGTAKPSERAVRRSVLRMNTPEGRQRHLQLLEKHPDCVNICDKHRKSALYRAAEAGDTEVMEKIIKAGIMPYFFHDAIYGAAHANQQAALDFLLAKGGVVGDDHVEVTMNMAYYYSEGPPEGGPSMTPELEKRYKKAWDMLKEAYSRQVEKRAADEELKKQVGPLVLTDKISVKGPLKLKGASRAKFHSDA